jgi:hypothetical protein
MRILEHDSDPDQRLLVLLMYMTGLSDIKITNDDERSMAWALAGKSVVVALPGDGSLRLKLMNNADLPAIDDTFN